jgi:hypothetical protein
MQSLTMIGKKVGWVVFVDWRTSAKRRLSVYALTGR